MPFACEKAYPVSKQKISRHKEVKAEDIRLTLIVCLLVSDQIRSSGLHHSLHLNILIKSLINSLLRQPCGSLKGFLYKSKSENEKEEREVDSWERGQLFHILVVLCRNKDTKIADGSKAGYVARYA